MAIVAQRTDWTREKIAGLFALPFTELVFRAAADLLRLLGHNMPPAGEEMGEVAEC